MHSYKTLNDAVSDKILIEQLIIKRGWLPMNIFNQVFRINPPKPLPKYLGWDRESILDIQVRQRWDQRWEIVMPRPKARLRKDEQNDVVESDARIDVAEDEDTGEEYLGEFCAR